MIMEKNNKCRIDIIKDINNSRKKRVKITHILREIKYSKIPFNLIALRNNPLTFTFEGEKFILLL